MRTAFTWIVCILVFLSTALAIAADQHTILTLQSVNANPVAVDSNDAQIGIPTAAEDVPEVNVVIEDTEGNVCFQKTMVQTLRVKSKDMTCTGKGPYTLKLWPVCHDWPDCFFNLLTPSDTADFNVGAACTQSLTWFSEFNTAIGERAPRYTTKLICS